MSDAAAVQRLEIFTGAGRRRRWPVEVKARIVAESHAPGETVCGVARRHGLTAQQLFAWRRQAREGVLVGACDDPVAFAPVVMAGPGPTMAPGGRCSPVRLGGTGVVIEMAGAVIRVPAGADAATLAAAVRAVKAAP
jgi:transposase